MKPRWVLTAVGLFGVLIVLNALVVDNQTAPGAAGSGQLIRLPGGALHVERTGPPSAPAIVLLPGLAESTTFWSRLVPLLGARFQVVRVDLLGEGLSAKPGSGYGVREQAHAIAVLLKKLGLCRPLLVGHSLGGLVALATAAQARSQVGGLVLIDVPPRANTMDLPIAAHLATWPGLGEFLHQIEPDWLIRQSLANALAPGHAVPDVFVHDFNLMTYESFKQLQQDAVAFLKDSPADLLAAHDGIAPLVIFGRQDRLISKSALGLWQRVGGAKLAVIERAGHDSAWEQPGPIESLIAQFAISHRLRGCATQSGSQT